MVKKKILGALLASIAVAGCAEMKELDDWAMKKAREDRATAPGQQADRAVKFKVPAEAQCSFNPGYVEADNCCIMTPYMSSLDLDTAFARAVQEYRFPTKVKERGRDPNPTRLYRYMSYPGQEHMAANEVRPRSSSALSQGFYMTLRIEKGAVDANSRIELAYCETPGLRATDQLAWHKAVQDSIYATLPPVQARKQ